MKFIVSSHALLKQLSGINGVITSNPVVPILENFLFEISEGSLVVTASDLQTSMIAELPVEAKDSGNIAIPAKRLMDTLKSLPNQPVTFSIDQDTYTVELSSQNGRYKLAGENATDFPKVPAVSNGDKVDLPSETLLRAISGTLFAASNDELRPAMNGVYVSFEPTHTTFVATDGHRLSRFRRVDITSDINNSVIIPKKALNLLKSSLPSDNTNVSMEYTSSNAYFTFGNVQMICRLIDERYPEYENVIPVENPNQLLINRADFLSSLKRVSIYANQTTHQVRLKITGSELHISAEDIDFSNEASEKLPCEYTGTDMEIGFNAKFLAEILNTSDTSQIKLELSEPNRAGLVIPVDGDENEDILMLVMPVMLNNYV